MQVPSFQVATLTSQIDLGVTTALLLMHQGGSCILYQLRVGPKT